MYSCRSWSIQGPDHAGDLPAAGNTPEDEAAIIGQVQRDGHYRCRRELDATSAAAIALVNDERQERGRVAKRHGVYAVLDARGHAVLRTRRLDEVLRALTK